MYNKLQKIYKIEKLQKIKQNYKHIYIFRYNNISNYNLILIKKKLKKLKINSIILKKNIINKKITNKNLQGCLFIIYDNNFKNLIKIIFLFNNLEFLIYKYKETFYSNLKLKKFFINLNKEFFNILLEPYIFFFKILKKI